MGRYLAEIAWETEVGVADAPFHLIHFDGVRFLGPYSTGGLGDDEKPRPLARVDFPFRDRAGA